MVVLQPLGQFRSKSLYRIEPADVSLDEIYVIQGYLKCQSLPPQVDSLSIDIGYSFHMTFSAASGQVTLPD
jgi:hypothetical protein